MSDKDYPLEAHALADRSIAHLADYLMGVREFVKGKPNLQVRLFVDGRRYRTRLVFSDGIAAVADLKGYCHPWIASGEEFLTWKFEDGFLVLREEPYGKGRAQNVVRPYQVYLIQVIELERMLQETTIPKVTP